MPASKQPSMYAYMQTGSSSASGGAASNDPERGHSIWSRSGSSSTPDVTVRARVGVTPDISPFDWVPMVAAGLDMYPVAPLFSPTVLASFSPPPSLPDGGDLVVHGFNRKPPIANPYFTHEVLNTNLWDHDNTPLWLAAGGSARDEPSFSLLRTEENGWWSTIYNRESEIIKSLYISGYCDASTGVASLRLVNVCIFLRARVCVVLLLFSHLR